MSCSVSYLRYFECILEKMVGYFECILEKMVPKAA